jgi:hypothetical protein
MLDEAWNPSITAGFEARFDKKSQLHIEGFYTGKTLAPRKADTWFSKKPPLPERDFDLYALSLVYTAPVFGVASDLAFSDTFAFGSDMYANLGFRVGNRPWQVSLALDGAGSRYVGRDGSAPGAGFRSGFNVERFGKLGSMFRLKGELRAGGLGEPFERGLWSAYYRFPSKFGALPVRPTRVSLSLSRNASNLEKIEDKVELTAGFAWALLRFSLSGALYGVFSSEEWPVVFPLPDSQDFSSARLGTDASYSIWALQIRMALGYTARKDRDALWDVSLGASLRGGPGRLGVTLKCEDFQKWGYTMSWRLGVGG